MGSFKFLITVLSLFSQVVLADAPVNADFPDWTPFMIQYKFCTTDGRVAKVQIKASNFSPFDMNLPGPQFSWATRAETILKAKEIFYKNVRAAMMVDSAAATNRDQYIADVLQSEAIFHGPNADGIIGDWKTNLATKTILEIKLALIEENKYSAFSIGYGAETFASVDYFSQCQPMVIIDPSAKK